MHHCKLRLHGVAIYKKHPVERVYQKSEILNPGFQNDQARLRITKLDPGPRSEFLYLGKPITQKS